MVKHSSTTKGWRRRGAAWVRSSTGVGLVLAGAVACASERHPDDGARGRPAARLSGAMLDREGRGARIDLVVGPSASAGRGPAAGAIELPGASGRIELSGEWEPATGELALSGGGHRVTGRWSTGRFEGEWAAPGERRGVVVAFSTATARRPAVHCGGYRGDDAGHLLLLAADADRAALLGASASRGLLDAVVTKRIESAVAFVLADMTFTGTHSGREVGGTWESEARNESGTWKVALDACPWPESADRETDSPP